MVHVVGVYHSLATTYASASTRYSQLSIFLMHSRTITLMHLINFEKKAITGIAMHGREQNEVRLVDRKMSGNDNV